jgi:hypothetical protein
VADGFGVAVGVGVGIGVAAGVGDGVGVFGGVGVGVVGGVGVGVGVFGGVGVGVGVFGGVGVGVEPPPTVADTSLEGGLSTAAVLYAVTTKKYVPPSAKFETVAAVVLPTSICSV